MRNATGRRAGKALGLGACLAMTCLWSGNVVAADNAAVPPVERLLAIEDIKQLKARYFRCVDQKDWECWRAVFAPDFVYQRPSGAIRGGDGMVEFIREVGLSDRVKTVHHGHMPEIEILSATTARGIWAANYLHYNPVGQPYPTTGKEVAAPGKGNETFTYYYETYVKVGGQWLIQTMDNSSHRLRTDDTGGILIPAATPPTAR